MASESAHIYEPANGHGLRHDPLTGIVGPRPIGWISTISAAGVPNLAPYSFFNALNYRPPLIGFSSTGWKDSVDNIAATKVFCWNLATADLGPAMNLSSTPAPADVDEFEVAGLTAAPGRLVAAPRVLESPVNFECRLSEIIQLHGADGTKVETFFVIGEVVLVYIDPDLIVEGVYQTTAARPLLRAGRLGDYIEVGPEAMRFMRRPGWPIE